MDIGFILKNESLQEIKDFKVEIDIHSGNISFHQPTSKDFTKAAYGFHLSAIGVAKEALELLGFNPVYIDMSEEYEESSSE